MPPKIGLESVFGTSNFSQGVNIYTNGLKAAVAATDQAKAQIDKAGGTIGDALRQGFGVGIGLGAFNAVVSGIETVIGAGVRLTETMISNVGELQQLSIALDSLAAKEVLASGQTEDVAEAFKIGEANADKMLVKIKEVSLESPFEYKDIVDTYRMAQAFGITSNLALDVTQAITNMTAGMGMNGQMMNRLIYNFGQMNRIGKIGARDIRDLAMAGLDLTEVLRTKLNMSVEETNAALARGELKFADVTQALIDYSNTFFGGAAERASRTLPGLISSFHDLLFFASTDVWGPATEVMTEFLGTIFDKARQIIDSGALLTIGEYLKAVAEVITESIQAAFPILNAGLDETTTAIGEFADRGAPRLLGSVEKMEDDLGVKAVDAFTWGANIVLNFAAGFLDAVETVLVSAMNALTDVLTSWLVGRSPPKVAPNVDIWGADLMNEYVKGMAEADFSALNAIQSPLKEAINQAVGLGILGEAAGIELFKNISRDIGKLLSGGGGGVEEIVSGLSKLGPISDELGALVKAQLNYALATKEAKKAQDELTAAKNRATTADNNLNIQIAKYNEMVRKGASQQELATQKALIDAAQQEQISAKEGVGIAEQKVDSTKEALDLLKQEMELQKLMFEELAQMAKEVFEPPPEAKKAKATGGVGGKKKTGPEVGPAVISEEMKKNLEAAGVPMQHLTGELTTEAELNAALAGNAFKTALTDSFKELSVPMGEITGSLDNMSKSWENLSKALEPITKSFGEGGDMQQVGKVFGFITIGLLLLTKVIMPAITILSALGTTFGAVATALSPILLAIAPLIPAIILLVAVIKIFGEDAKRNFLAIADEIAILLPLLWENIKLFFTNLFADIGADFTQFGVDIGLWWEQTKTDWNTNIEAVKLFFSGLWTKIQEVWAGIKADFTQFGLDFALWWETTKTEWQANIDGLKTMFSTWATDAKTNWDTMLANITAFFADAGKAISDFVTVTIPDFISDMITAGSDLISGLWDGMKAKWGEVVAWLTDIAMSIINSIKSAWEEKSPSKVAYEVGSNFTKGILLGLKSEGSNLLATAMDTFKPVGMAAQPALASSIDNSIATNINMNNTVRSDLDMAMLEAVIRRVINNTVRG